MTLSPEQARLSPEELKKDVHLRAAEGLLKEVHPDIDFEWVKKGEIKGAAAVKHAAGRTVIQFEG
ncbi:hypothetical protein ABIC65_000634 [Sphingomonas trueperi]|uniref:hypothetical protein n=1 Tax=Sphingomonas trueperi TaxID=53317 RepID=UPI003398568D